MGETPDLTVVARVGSYQRARDLVAATRLAMGNAPRILLLAPKSLLADWSDSRAQWAGVQWQDISTPVNALPDLVDTSYVLAMPPSHVWGLSGVGLALDVLCSSSDLDEVGGLIQGRRGAMTSGALRQVNWSETGGVTTASLESSYPDWSKAGHFAVTRADLLGGPVVLAKKNLDVHHLSGSSVFTRALGGLNAPTARRCAVFSGFVVSTRSGPDALFLEDGQTEALEPTSYERWLERGISEVVVIHRGRALRDDAARIVRFHALNQVVAVDNEYVGEPENPSAYFASGHSAIQLGPGFETIQSRGSHVSGHLVTEDDYRGSIEGLTRMERHLLRLARTLGAKLPGPLLRVALRALNPLGRKQK